MEGGGLSVNALTESPKPKRPKTSPALNFLNCECTEKQISDYLAF